MVGCGYKGSRELFVPAALICFPEVLLMPDEATPQPAGYTDYHTIAGDIRVHHEMTLGDMANSTLLAVLILVVVLHFLIKKIWED